MAEKSDTSLRVRAFPGNARPEWAGAYPTQVSHMVIHGRTDPWSVPFYCAHLVLRGPMRLRMPPDIDTVLHVGDMFAIYADRDFAYHADDTSGRSTIELYAMRLAGPLAGEYIRALGFRQHRPKLHAADREAAQGVFEQLLKIAEESPADFVPRSIAILQQLLPAAAYQPTPDQTALPLAERALDIMCTELSNGCNVDEITRALGVSRVTLFQHFRQHYGKTPIQSLIELRMERAEALLANTDLPIAEIARNAGFGHLSHFARQFKQITGYTPTRFRAMALKK